MTGFTKLKADELKAINAGLQVYKLQLENSIRDIQGNDLKDFLKRELIVVERTRRKMLGMRKGYIPSKVKLMKKASAGGKKK